ncbi:MAG: ribosomal-processing cysteine protease Prp [Treponema sp.]|nr:ribosomal-processing cysteine protease Prp [Candidatus Treponema merdequi]
MTKVLLVKANDGSALHTVSEGHSGFAEKGKDIVCSAVTILMRTAIGLLSDTSGIELKTDTSLRGYLSFEARVLKDDSKLKERLSTIGDFLKEGFESLSEEFPQNVKLDFKLED